VPHECLIIAAPKADEKDRGITVALFVSARAAAYQALRLFAHIEHFMTPPKPGKFMGHLSVTKLHATGALDIQSVQHSLDPTCSYNDVPFT
jgi:hypothetical protein